MNITLKSNFQNVQAHMNDATNAYPDLVGMIQLELDELQEFKHRIEIAESEREEKLTKILSPEQIVEMNSIKSYYQEILTHFNNQISAIETNVKELVAEHGESVKGDTLHAVYSDGRKTWDTKGLEGYAVANPDVLNFRKEGKPSVSIRKAK